MDQIVGQFEEGKGVDQAHRVMVLQTEVGGTAIDEQNRAKIEIHPLTVGASDDASFTNYRMANDEEIREALGLSEVYFKSGKLTKASAVVAKATTDEQEFQPARALMEHFFNQRILRRELNAPNTVLRFRRPETQDPLESAQVHNFYSEMGAITPNEVRIALGRDPFPDTEEWANVPIPVALLRLEGRNSGEPARDATNPASDNPSTESDPAEPDASDEPADEPGSEPDSGEPDTGEPAVNRALASARALLLRN